MEILKNFGFDPILLVAQIVNFLIILFILKKLLYKPVMDMLKKRETSIKEGIKQAEEGRLALEKALEEEKKILKKAQDQSKKIVEDANTEAINISKEIEDNSRKQAEKILEEARRQIEQEAKETERRLSQNITNLSIELLTKSLGQMFGEKEQKQLIEKAVKELKGKKS
ncbi:MAG: F0F1 ATP synthase subunit B [Patescibacteria group bacterium]|nr:F0F1 ATP synthase subunit B [Patescibacteria group bacterium]